MYVDGRLGFLIVFEGEWGAGVSYCAECFDLIMAKWLICSVGPVVAFSAAGLACDCDAVSAPGTAGEAAAAPRWGWEAAVVYNHAFTDIRKHSPAPRIDTWGAEVTGLYRVRGNHFASFRFGYAYGDEGGFELQRFVLAPGYRYCRVLSEDWCVFAGAYAGLGVSVLDSPGMVHRSHALSRKDDMANVVYGAELGVRYQIAPNTWLLGSLGVNAGSAPFHSARFENATEEQVNLSFGFGIGGCF